MKVVFILALLLALVTVKATREITPKSADEVLHHLQGNNYNIYLLHFYESSNRDEKVSHANEDILNMLKKVVGDNPDFYYARIDLSDREFSKLGNVVGLTSAPAVLMIVHGKGVWLSGTNASLMADRLRDFLPAFKQASAHHTNPY